MEGRVVSELYLLTVNKPIETISGLLKVGTEHGEDSYCVQ